MKKLICILGIASMFAFTAHGAFWGASETNVAKIARKMVRSELSTNGLLSVTGTGPGTLHLGASNGVGGMAFQAAAELPVNITNIFNFTNVVAGQTLCVESSNNWTVVWGLCSGSVPSGLVTNGANADIWVTNNLFGAVRIVPDGTIYQYSTNGAGQGVVFRFRNTNSTYQVASSVNGAAFSNLDTMTSSGNRTIGGQVTATLFATTSGMSMWVNLSSPVTTELISTNSTGVSNITVATSTAASGAMEMFPTNNLTWTNFTGLSSAIAGEKTYHIRPQFTLTNLFPDSGNIHGARFVKSMANPPFISMTQGVDYLLKFKWSRTNVFISAEAFQ